MFNTFKKTARDNSPVRMLFGPPSRGEQDAPPVRMKSFEEVKDRLDHVEKMQVSGRYHKLPVQIDHHYDLETDDGEKVLGVGVNGSVVKAHSRCANKHAVAVKSFDFAGVPGTKLAQLESEVEVFLSMDHPNVARLLDVYESEQHMDLVMEHLEGGELFDRVKSCKRFSERDTAEVTWQMLLALNYMHELKMVHGDIKLENWMYSQKDKNHLKLIDFGFSKMRGQVSEKACGTISYMAPEVLGLHFGPEGDMWSLGVLVFVLLSGSMPFPGTTEQKLQAISRGEYTMKRERWASTSTDAIDFVKKLLKVEPSRRMSAEAALRHPFIANKHFERRLQVDSSVVDALCQFSHKEKFRRVCLFMMAWSLSEEERAQVEEAFLAIDTHHGGRITYDELYAIMVDKFRLPVAEVKNAFKALSVHGDGEIHYSDFLAAMVSSKIKISQEILQECWQKLDTDGSGYITDAHLKEVLGEKFNGTPTNTMLRDVGTLRPGQMSWHEFVCYMQGKPLHLHGDEMMQHLDLPEIPRGDSASKIIRQSSTKSIGSITSGLSRARGASKEHSEQGESTQSSCALM